MNKTKCLTGAILCILLLMPGIAKATSVSFNLEIPTIPYPPLITDISNSLLVASAGDSSFVISATIVGQMQRRPKCDIVPKSACSLTDWHFIDEPGVTPNPPDVKFAKVYYYKNTDVQTALNVPMAIAPELGDNKWKATVTINNTVEGDTVTFYIVTGDSRGNVSSQVPDTGTVNQTCPSSPTGWNTEFSTPATTNCAYMTSVSRCQLNYDIPPAVTCPTTFTMNDPDNDVCGEPDGNGAQTVISLPKMDIKGLSAAADGTNFCANYGLGASPPDPTDPSPIEGYLMIIFNPDIYDENPADLWIKNAFAMTFAPEIVGTDPSLVRVLWDANCLTDPNTPNILDCKLINITGSDPKLQIGYNNGLKFIVKRSGTGDPLAVPYSLIGGTSKMAYLIAVTGEINLSGGTAFWFSDLTPGMGFIQKNQVVTAGPPTNPGPPIVSGSSTKCSVDGSGGTNNICAKSATKPAQNKCKITFAPSLDAGIVTEYRLYRNVVDSFSSASKIDSVLKGGSLSFTDSIPESGNGLDGSTKYYYLTSYNANASDISKRETLAANVSKQTCTVEDWVPPATPVISEAKTPAGNEAKCKLKFSMPGLDPSLKSFFMSRDGVALNFSNQMGANNATTTFEWTDPSTLELGHAPYAYTVTATDLGDNTKTSVSSNCTTEDLKAPTAINSALASNLPGTLGVHMEWQASTESDLSGYNVFYCPQVNASSSCKVFDGQFTKLNSSILSGTTVDNSTAFVEGDYCFYAEACDKCDTLVPSTCPSNTGKPNCSGFPAGGAASTMYVKCLTITNVPDPLKPAFPSSVAVTAPPEGKKCKLTWAKNYKQSTGLDFVYEISPKPADITGYKIMRGDAGAEPPTPAQAAAAGLVTGGSSQDFTDTAVLNGTLQSPVTYKYSVYAIDGSGNFSEGGAGGAISTVTCNPRDTVAPNVPTMNASGYGPASCSPAWQPVSETGVTYKLYKCTGDAATCNGATKFAEVSNTDACVRDGGGTTCTDNDVTADTTYRYCVTALDDSSNESSKYPTGAQPNCAPCTPSARPRPITAVTAAPTSDNFGVKLYWTNSLDTANSSSAGVNVYRCTTVDCTTKTKVKACNTLLANSTQVQGISALAPLSIPTGEPVGTWFYGATYQGDCSDALTESFLVGTAIGVTAVTINAPPVEDCPNPATCIVISSCTDPIAHTGCDGTLSMIDTSAGYPAGGTKFPVVPKAGVNIYVISAAGNELGHATTDALGNYKIQIDNTGGAVNLADKYQIIVKVTGADKAGVPCNNDLLPPAFVGTDCGIIAKGDVTLTQGASAMMKVALPKIPAANQGRSEMANPNCDDTIDGGDFLILRNNYGKDVGPGAGDAKNYADFNGDGTVDGDDFLILRQNYGKNLTSGAPTLVPGLCDH